jgi:hypothetical protein
MTPPILRDDYLIKPITRRLQGTHPHFAQIMKRHAEAVATRLPCYQDPVSGLSVMTAEFLASRNYCCESGCRHCPYVTD